MEETIIYLIRHAETIDENGIRNTDETMQEINEKEILSIEGEIASKKLSENEELKNIDVIWCSNYTRAKQTAKYIAFENGIQYNLDKRLCERKLGNIDDLAKFMADKETRDPSREQLAFPEFKTRDGESANETNKRVSEFINEILEKYKGKKIAVISHGGAIKFYLLNCCNVDDKLNLEFEGKKLNIASPSILKLTFTGSKLNGVIQIK